MIDTKWEFLPKIGLGLLKFNMDQEEVASLNGIYGDPFFAEETRLLPEVSSEPNSVMQETIELMRSIDPNTDWEKMYTDLAAEQEERLPESFKNMIEERREPWLSLSYKESKLRIINTGLDNKKATFEDLLIFKENSRDIVNLFEHKFGNPLFNGRDLYFPNALLTLSDFYVDIDGNAFFTSENSGNVSIEEFQRTLTIYSVETGRLEAITNNLDGFKQVSFL